MKRFLITLGLLLSIVALSGCAGRSTAATPPSGSISYTVVEESKLPAEVLAWIESVTNGSTKPANLSKSFGDKTYLLVYAGERSSGGYSITFKSVVAKEGKLSVEAQIAAPKGPATMAITYPWSVIAIDKFEGEVGFKVTESK